MPPVVVPLASGGARRFLEQVTGGNVQGKFPRIVDDTKKKLLWEQVAAPPDLRRQPNESGAVMNRIGVAIVGINGAVASTLIAGVELMKRGLAPRIGMVTERTDARIAESLTELLDFAPLESLVFGGLGPAVRELLRGRAPPQGAAAARTRAGQAPSSSACARGRRSSRASTSRTSPGKNVVRARTHREQIASLEQRPRELQEGATALDRVVMVNLASTERFLEVQPVHHDLRAFEAGLDASDPAHHAGDALLLRGQQAAASRTATSRRASRTSRRSTSTPTRWAIRSPGMDGKTGQTLLKTALASMFRARRLLIEGWYSTNFLGNSDGLVLDAPSSNKTKVLSKSAVLDSIVGYHVENHQVHIHYYKPRGDSKEAWDNIDIVGFAGIPMQMKVNFLCQDSALAAPLVIDLVRLLDVAQALRRARHPAPALDVLQVAVLPARGDARARPLQAGEAPARLGARARDAAGTASRQRREVARGADSVSDGRSVGGAVPISRSSGERRSLPRDAHRLWPIITDDERSAVARVLDRGILSGPFAPEARGARGGVRGASSGRSTAC